MIFVRHGQSEFNVHFSETRIDPGIIDPRLTPLGRRQALAAAEKLKDQGHSKILASPYWRALETAEILAGELDLEIEVEPLVRERAFFTCDVGSHRSELSARWPHLVLGHLEEEWWPAPFESDEELAERCMTFRTHSRTLAVRQRYIVVSHWGFIRGLTGLSVGNGELVPFDPLA